MERTFGVVQSVRQSEVNNGTTAPSAVRRWMVIGMDEYIKREKIRESYEKLTRSYMHGEPYIADWRLDEMIENLPAADVASVRHGRWELTTNSFYRDTFDESCELCVYIVANCSECSGKHPNSYQVFSKTLYAPDDADDDFRFDKKAEEEKALLEFRNKKYEFAHYCPNCGAKMDGE